LPSKNIPLQASVVRVGCYRREAPNQISEEGPPKNGGGKKEIEKSIIYKVTAKGDRVC